MSKSSTYYISVVAIVAIVAVVVLLQQYAATAPVSDTSDQATGYVPAFSKHFKRQKPTPHLPGEVPLPPPSRPKRLCQEERGRSRNPTKMGTVMYTNKKYTDYCKGNLLYEYGCENDKPKATVYDCTKQGKICQAGTCVPQPQQRCTQGNPGCIGKVPGTRDIPCDGPGGPTGNMRATPSGAYRCTCTPTCELRGQY